MKDRSYLTSSDLAMDRSAIERSFASHVEYTIAKDEYSVTPRDFYRAIALSVRDRIADRWNKTQQKTFRAAERRVYYLSLEYLVGRLLDDSMLNLGITGEARAAMDDLGLDLGDLAQYEDDAGLGNGGLGRLAACFLDSMATLGIPSVGYGIRYEYGIFRQSIVDGAQVEQPDNWLRYPNPWEVARPERLFMVRFGGRVETVNDNGRESFKWVDTENVMAMAYDTPVPGYRNDVVNSLRLWSAKATREFDLGTFNRGDYVDAVHDKTRTENLSRVLYPNDSVARRQGAAPSPGVLLRLGDAAGRHPSAPGALARRAQPARLFGLPAERHPPGRGHRRDDAPAHGRPLAGVGRGVVGHDSLLQLHQPHGAARGARAVDRLALRPDAAAVPADRLRDQPPLPRGGAREVPRRRRPPVAHVAHRGGARAAHPHGAPGDRGQRARQRRVGPAQPHPARAPVPRLRRDVAAQVRQPDQRRDAPAVASQVQPGAVGARRRRRSARGGSPICRS